MISRALVVPFTPGLRQVWTTIDATEYDHLAHVYDLPRPLRGVGLVGTTNSVAGAVSPNSATIPGSSVSALVGLGGYYENPDALYKKGMTQIKLAPFWLQAVSTSFFNARFSAGPQAVRGMAAAPRPAVAEEAALHPLSRMGQARTLWNDFSRLLYLQERLQGRRVTLRGRLRLDIAPGSSVRVVLSKERYLRQNGDDIDFLYGHVNRVTVSIDCENQKAYTLFNISHTRSPRENGLDSYSTEQHFLYENVFRGAPLLEAVAPPDLPDDLDEVLQE
jgi:hypothetical protein